MGEVNVTIDVLTGITSTWYCHISKYIGPSIYNLYKTMLYITLVCRIYKSFQNSELQYNTKALILWIISLIIWTIFNIIYGCLTVTTITVNKGFPKCVLTPTMIYLASNTLLDIVSTIINGILFVKPLFKLYKISKFDINIKIIAIKQCILSMTAIISSILTLICCALFQSVAHAFISLDICISTLCIILMFKWNSFITSKIFCCCIPSPQQTKDIVKLEIVVTEETKTKSTRSIM